MEFWGAASLRRLLAAQFPSYYCTATCFSQLPTAQSVVSSCRYDVILQRADHVSRRCRVKVFFFFTSFSDVISASDSDVVLPSNADVHMTGKYLPHAHGAHSSLSDGTEWWVHPSVITSTVCECVCWHRPKPVSVCLTHIVHSIIINHFSFSQTRPSLIESCNNLELI